MIRNYQTLVIAAEDYLGRSNLGQSAHRYTALAENDLARRLDTPEQDVTVQLTFDVNGTAPVPPDYRAPLELRLGDPPGNISLAAISAAVRDAMPFQAGYWLEGQLLRIRPYDTENPMPASLRYTANMAPLSVANPVNQWLRAYPNAYLYALCKHIALNAGRDPDLQAKAEPAAALLEAEFVAITRDVDRRKWKNVRLVRKGPRP